MLISSMAFRQRPKIMDTAARRRPIAAAQTARRADSRPGGGVQTSSRITATNLDAAFEQNQLGGI